MDGTILARSASCIDSIIARIDFDEIDGKIKLIYELLYLPKGQADHRLLADIR